MGIPTQKRHPNGSRSLPTLAASEPDQVCAGQASPWSPEQEMVLGGGSITVQARGSDRFHMLVVFCYGFVAACMGCMYSFSVCRRLVQRLVLQRVAEFLSSWKTKTSSK